MSTSAVHTGDDVPVRQQSASGLRLYILLQLFAGQALFGSTTPLSKIIADAFPVFSAALLRMSIASAVLVIILLMTSHKFTRLCRRDWLAVFGVTFFGMLGVTSLMLFGMRMTSGVIGATVISSTPAVTALAAVIFIGSNMNWTKAGALALAVVGVLAVNLLQQGGDGGSAVFLGTLLVAGAVCCQAAFTLLSKQVSEGVHSGQIILFASALAIPAFFALAWFFDPQPFDYSGGNIKAWGAVLFWGAASGAVAPILWYNGAREAPGVLVASFMAVLPLSALVLSYILLGEAFHWAHLLGFGLVFAGLILMIFEEIRESRRPAKS